MKTASILLFFIITSVSLFSQEQDDIIFVSSSTERDTIFAVVPRPVLSVGVSGGLAFIDPEKINNQIEYNNSIFNGEEFPIKRPSQAAVWLSYRPKNFPNFIFLRAEMLTSSRTYSFITKVTRNNPATQDAASSSTFRYSVYPFSIGTGTVVYKTLVKAEIAFIYALGFITQETSVYGFPKSTSEYEGDGYGFRVNLQQVLPVHKTFGITIDIGYRFLLIDEFRDAKGVLIKDIEMNYSGINIMGGVSYGF